MNKKAGLHWEYLAVIILVLLVIVLGLLFLDTSREMVTSKGKEFFDGLLKSIGR